MRALILLFAVACYGAFFVTFLYLVGWIGGFDAYLPTTVNKGLDAPPMVAVVIDLALIALFGLQHSVMARRGFKESWTKIVPAAAERSFYLLGTVAVLAVMFAYWHPVAGSLWTVENHTARMAIWALFGLGWVILFVSTWLLNHFELFGLQQAWYHFRGQDLPAPKMRTPVFYKLVRHPIYAGFFIAFWATPDMTYSHFIASIGFTAYIVIGIAYEEKDLLRVFGEEYADYRRRVGSFLPGIGKSS